MNGNRTVHAEDDLYELVRYERAGKWFIEKKPGGPAVPALHVTLAKAVMWVIHFGKPGGRIFDARVRKAGIQ